MSGYLTHQAARVLNPARALRPELPSIFAAPRVAEDAPFESEILSEASNLATPSNVHPGHAQRQSAPPMPASDNSRGMRAANVGTPRDRRSATAEAHAAPPESVPHEVTSSAMPTQHPAQQSQPANRLQEKDVVKESVAEPIMALVRAPLESIAREVVPAEVPSQSFQASRSREGAGREASEFQPSSAETHVHSTSASSRPIAGRASRAESAGSPSGLPLRANDHEFDSPSKSARPSTPSEDIERFRSAAGAGARPSTDPEFSTSTPFSESFTTVPQDLQIKTPSNIPAQLRALGQASAQATRPNAHPEQTAEPAIQVTIGRIEVRAPSNTATTRNTQRPSTSGPTLEEYLRTRSQRGRA
jgi:hypothetical protein